MFVAVYLDGGIGAASDLIHRLPLDAEREEAVEERRRDYKTALQELVRRQADQVLTYRMAGEQGPDHDKTFLAEVLANGTPVGTGSGHSKKEAEQAPPKRPWRPWARSERRRKRIRGREPAGHPPLCCCGGRCKYDWNLPCRHGILSQYEMRPARSCPRCGEAGSGSAETWWLHRIPR